MFSTIVAISFLANGVDVRSATRCPSSEAILAKLGPLLPSGGEAGDVVWVESASQGQEGAPQVHLRLVHSDASVGGDRNLQLQGDCDEMADTIATVLAAWKTQPVDPPAARIVDAQRRVQPAERGEVSLARMQLWIGAGGGVGFVGGSVGTGRLEFEGARAGSHGFLRMAGIVQTERERGLDVGTVHWRRTNASLGIGWKTLRSSSWQASADVAALLGWLTVSGRGFTPDDQHSAFEYGVGAGLRGQRDVGDWALWLECRMNLWAQKERATLSGSSLNTGLPGFDLLATLGVSRLILR